MTTKTLVRGSRLFVFIDLDGEAGAHPAANTTAIALLGIGEGREKITLGGELISGHQDAPSGAEFGAVAASFADRFVDYYFTFSHVSP